MRTIQEYRVFIASPGGLGDIREAFRDELAEFTHASALRRGFLFTPVGWENTLGGPHRAQALINKELVECDALLLVLWDRWGSPPDKEGRHSSGSEEEWTLGLQCLRAPDCSMRTVAAIFKAVEPGKLDKPDSQLQKVLDFRKELEASKEHLYMTFDVESGFRRLLRRYLASWLYEVESGIEVKPTVEDEPKASGYPVELDSFQVKEPVLVHRSGRAVLGPRPAQDDVFEAERLANAGSLTEAETLYARAIASGDDPDAFNRYGHFLMRLGRLEQAQVMFQRVLELAATEGEEWRAKALGNLGLIYQGQGKPEEARSSLEQALDLFERQEDPTKVATAMTNLGNLALGQQQLDEAEHLFRQALEAFQQSEACEAEVPVLYGNLGLVYHSRGNQEQAEALLRQALEAHQRLGSAEWVATDSANLGLVLQARGKEEAARNAWNRARDLFTQVGAIQKAQQVEDLLAASEREQQAQP